MWWLWCYAEYHRSAVRLGRCSPAFLWLLGPAHRARCLRSLTFKAIDSCRCVVIHYFRWLAYVYTHWLTSLTQFHPGTLLYTPKIIAKSGVVFAVCSSKRIPWVFMVFWTCLTSQSVGVQQISPRVQRRWGYQLHCSFAPGRYPWHPHRRLKGWHFESWVQQPTTTLQPKAKLNMQGSYLISNQRLKVWKSEIPADFCLCRHSRFVQEYGIAGIAQVFPYQNKYGVFHPNRVIKKSSILVGSSITNHPFGGTPISGNLHIDASKRGCIGPLPPRTCPK